MGEKGRLPDIDALVEENDNSEAVWEAIMDEAPELPPRVQHLSPAEIRDLDLTQIPEAEARKVVEWAVYRWRAAGQLDQAQ